MAYNAKTNWLINEVVQPADMNRIEAGIAANDFGKADRDLSNVTAAAFSSKAASSNVEVYGTTNKVIYVSTSGNDTTGTGESAAPYKTIQKAIDSIPETNPFGVTYTINVLYGTHAGFTVKGNKKIKLNMGASATLGNIIIYAGNIEILGTLTCTGYVYVYGGFLNAQYIKFTGSGGNALFCSHGGQIGITGWVEITGYTNGINCENSHAYIRQITMTGGNTGVQCTCGAVYIGTEAIASTTKYLITHGGSVFVGSKMFAQE